MREDTPDFNIDPDGGMVSTADFTYDGHRVEIVPSDNADHIGNFWQIMIDGVIRGLYLSSSARMAAEKAKKLVDAGSFLEVGLAQQTGTRVTVQDHSGDTQ